MIFPSKPLKTWKKSNLSLILLVFMVKKTYKIKNSVIENIILGSKLRRWNGLFCMQIKLLLLSNTIFKPSGLRSSALSCCNNHYNILLFEEQMWPLLQLYIFKFINLAVKRTSTSIEGQALFSRNFIKPTMYLGVPIHILTHHLLVL